MPLWDNTFQQVQSLPSASAYDGANDTFPIWDNSAGYTGQASLQEARPLEQWSLAVSSAPAASTGPVSTIAAKTAIIWPYDFTITAIQVGVTTAVTSGTLAVDVMKDNGSTVTSIIDNTTGVAATLTLTSADNGGAYKSVSPHASQTTITQGDEIEVYAVTLPGGGGLGCKVKLIGYRT